MVSAGATVALGFEMTLGRFEGTPVGTEEKDTAVLAEDAAIMVVGSHIEVALFVPVGMMVSGAGVVNVAELVRVTIPELVAAEGEVAVDATTVPLVAVCDAETAVEADNAVEAESDVTLPEPVPVGLTRAVELADVVSEITVALDVGETRVVGGVVAETMVMLLVGGITEETSLLVGGTEIEVPTETDQGVVVGRTAVAELVAVTVTADEVLPTSLDDGEATSLVVVPKMLEIMLPRPVVSLDVETAVADEAVDKATPVPVDAGPDTPEVDVGAEPVPLNVVATKLETSDEVAESVEETGEEAGTRVESTEEISEVSIDNKDGKRPEAAVEVGTVESVALAEVVSAESVPETVAVPATPESVAEVAVDAEPLTPVDVARPDAVESAEVVGATIEETSELTSDKTELIIGRRPALVELVGAVTAPVPVNETPEVEAATAVEPPVPVNEMPDETALSVLEAPVSVLAVPVAAVDPPVPVNETPELRLDAVEVAESELLVDEVTIPPGAKVIALPELAADDVETSLIAKLAVGETMIVGTDPVEATDAVDAVGETTIAGTDPVDATKAV